MTLRGRSGVEELVGAVEELVGAGEREVDYALQRRSTLEALRRPQRSLESLDVCDADPLLIRSAKHHGERSNVACTICRVDHLTNLNYVFGDQLGQYSGRIRSTAELEQMENEVGEFMVRVVEVCVACGWCTRTSRVSR